MSDSQNIMLSSLRKPDSNDGSIPGLIYYKYNNDTLSSILSQIYSIPLDRFNDFSLEQSKQKRQVHLDTLKSFCNQ